MEIVADGVGRNSVTHHVAASLAPVLHAQSRGAAVVDEVDGHRFKRNAGVRGQPTGPNQATAELSVNIVRAATSRTGPLRAIGTVIHCGRQLATAEARIVGPDGKLYAHGTTTCLVFEVPRRAG